eukprot:Gb_29706 [translate_table: standard]
MYVATDPAQRYKVTSVFQQAAAHGLTVARTWAFNDGHRDRALQASPGHTMNMSFRVWISPSVKRESMASDLYSASSTTLRISEESLSRDGSRKWPGYVKSIDRNHMVEVGLEGFYGESTPERKESNPSGYVVGTDFITDNQVQDIDFATVHSYPDIWLSGSDEEAKLSFLEKWVEKHLEDASRVVKKPVLFAEFRKSSICKSASSGGAAGGGLVWQLMAEGMDSFDDGYDIVLSESPSTAAVISSQSRKMSALNRMSSSQKRSRKAYAGGNSEARKD